MPSDNEWRKRITVDPAVHHGDPCITGTRVPVSVIVGSVADGDTFERILAAYPQLKREDIQAALQYTAKTVVKHPDWTMSQERAFTENLLCQRFNFLVVLCSLIVIAALNVPEQGLYLRPILLLVGCALCFGLAMTIHRLDAKLTLILESLEANHPMQRIDKAAEGLNWRESLWSTRHIVGRVVPWLCVLALFVFGVASAFGSSASPSPRAGDDSGSSLTTSDWISIVMTVVLFATLVVLIIYTYYTRQIAQHGKLPAVSFKLDKHRGEVALYLQNHSPLGVTVTLDMQVRLLGELVEIANVYAGTSEWPLLPNDHDHGAYFLLQRSLETRFRNLSTHVESIDELREEIRNPPEIKLRNVEHAPGETTREIAREELTTILDWEQQHGNSAALTFDLCARCKTHGTSIKQDTPRRRWYYKFSTGQLVLDII